MIDRNPVTSEMPEQLCILLQLHWFVDHSFSNQRGHFTVLHYILLYWIILTLLGIVWILKRRTKSRKSLSPLQREPYENHLINNSCWEQSLSPHAALHRNEHRQKDFKKSGERLRKSCRRDGGVREMVYRGWKLVPRIAVQLLVWVKWVFFKYLQHQGLSQ